MAHKSSRDVTVEYKPFVPDIKLHSKGRMRWWEDGPRAHEGVFSVVNHVESRQRSRRTWNLLYASLYENIQRSGSHPGVMTVGVRSSTGGLQRSEVAGSNQRACFNGIASCVDTATAKIAKNKPRVKYATSNGSWTQQQRARRRTQFTDAAFRVSGFKEQAVASFRDGSVFGTGHVFFREVGDKVVAEKVCPLDVTVDEDDAVDSKPSQMHRRKAVRRDALIAEYPNFEREIGDAPELPDSNNSIADMVLVIESWRLPSGPKSTDGRHVVCLQNVTLVDEQWSKDWFPCVQIRWARKLVGFNGRAMTEELAGLQLKLNRLDKMIDVGIESCCIPRCFVPAGAVVATHKLFDFGVISYKGQTPPTFSTAAAMPPEVYQEREATIAKMYKVSGISELSASSQKPAGLNSGAAIREYQDQNSERFSDQGDRWEDVWVEAARILLDIYQDMHKRGVTVALLAIGQRNSRMIQLEDVLLDEADYVRSAFPVSQLPNTPEGKLQFTTELSQAGYIDHDMALELLQLGDVDDGMSLLTAPFDDALMLIDQMLEDGEPASPEPYMNLALTQKLAQSAYLRAHHGHCPEERLALLRAFLEQLASMMTPPQTDAGSLPAPGAGPGPAGGPPIAVPNQPPTSDILPIQGAAA